MFHAFLKLLHVCIFFGISNSGRAKWTEEEDVHTPHGRCYVRIGYRLTWLPHQTAADVLRRRQQIRHKFTRAFLFCCNAINTFSWITEKYSTCYMLIYTLKSPLIRCVCVYFHLILFKNRLATTHQILFTKEISLMRNHYCHNISPVL